VVCLKPTHPIPVSVLTVAGWCLLRKRNPKRADFP
jgi:hypothetical protein